MPYKTRKVGNKYCVYKKDGGKKVGCTDGTKEALRKYLAALHIAEDEVEVKMESFKFFFESKDADIEDLIKMIKNPDPSKVKEYGGTEYVDMLRKKLARLRADIEYLNPEEIQKFAYNLGYEDIESSDMPNYFDYEGKRYYIKDEGNNWEIWANAWNEGEKDSRADDYSNRADYYRELEIYGEDEQSKIRKGGAGKAFYTGTRVEKDKKKEKSKKRARGKVRDEDAQDRCKRKADQVYGKKTSAYKSGAIVRCRKGKIWKKK